MKKILVLLSLISIVFVIGCAIKSDGKLEASVDPTIVPWGDSPASQPAK